MNKVLVVGCGDLGGEVARLLNLSGCAVTGVRASNKALPHITCIQADVRNIESLQQMNQLRPDIIIYCVAANAQTDESYYQHYVLGLQNVMSTQKENTGLKHVFFVSSSRVYGQTGEQSGAQKQLTNIETFDENSPAVPHDFGGTRLLEAENYARRLSHGTTILRLSGIYGQGRFQLIKLAKSPASWPAQNNWSNRIHRDDAARFIAYLVEKIRHHEEVAETYIVTDDLPVLQYDVLMWLATQMQIDTSQVAIPHTQGGKKLSNARLTATGFKLDYADYQIGYRALLPYV